jgi:hypothetical protein
VTGPAPLPDITRRDVQDRINALAAAGLAPAAVRHAYRAVFKSVLNDAIDDGLLPRSPCHRIELPAAVLPAIEPLTPAQVLTLASLIDPRYRAMVLLAAGCGLRWSEAAGLTRDRIYLGARAQVTIDRQLGYRPPTKRHGPDAAARPLFAPPKTGASCRVIPMPAAAAAARREHLRSSPPARTGCCSPPAPGTCSILRTGGSGSGGPWSGPRLASRPALHSIASGTPTPRCWAMSAFPIMRSSGGSATPTPARSAGTAIPTPTQGTGRPPATQSTPPSPQPRPAASGQQRVDFVDRKVDQPRAGSGQHKRFRRSQGMHGCAARDLDPEPAVKSRQA